MFTRLMENTKYYCDKCQLQLSCRQSFCRHLKTQGHLGIEKIKPLIVKKIVEQPIKKERKKRAKKVYYCEIHDKYFKNHSNLKDHLNSKKHTQNVDEPTEQKIDPGLLDYIRFFNELTKKK